MKKNVVFFEVRGGSDKGADGYRKDTMPMVDALKERGWNAEVIFFEVAKKDEIYKRVLENFDGYISRINPGNLKEENEYFAMLRQLCADGLIGMPHPDAMIGYGAKDALTKLAGTNLVPQDTYAYYDIKTFKETFPKTLAKGERVLKQNRGSTGEGIWRVCVEGAESSAESLPLNTKIKCTEAKDNHSEHRELGEFMDFCEQYIIGDNGMLVDMTFLPRIKEGEIRLLMLYDKPVNVVHKKPAEGADAFSATLFSGAKYRYDSPSQWQNLVDMFLGELPNIRQKLGNYDLPLIWTADFILDTDENGADKYILGEINCSCVGFTSHLELAGEVAENIIKIVSKAKG
ncbi:Cj0069 family protein [Helicobacter sp. 23-1045]